MQIVLPTRECAQHVLRCAYNEVCGEMARDKLNSLNYLPFARDIGEWFEVFFVVRLYVVIFV